MGKFEGSIDVQAPLSMAYNQWTQFEKFPEFMEGVKEVHQLDDTRLLWRAEIAGTPTEWYAKITEQTPDQRIAWTSVTGARNAGVVTFHYLDPQTTRVMLQLDYEPEGAIQTIGDVLGVVKARVNGDLQRFKEYIEARGQESGAWRGTVERGGAVQPDENHGLTGRLSATDNRGDGPDEPHHDANVVWLNWLRRLGRQRFDPVVTDPVRTLSAPLRERGVSFQGRLNVLSGTRFRDARA